MAYTFTDFVDGYTNWPMYAMRQDKLRLLAALPGMDPATRRYWVHWLACRNAGVLAEWQAARDWRASGAATWYWNREAEKLRRYWTALKVDPARIAAKVQEYRDRGLACKPERGNFTG